MHCTRCAAPLPAGSAYCTACGLPAADGHADTITIHHGANEQLPMPGGGSDIVLYERVRRELARDYEVERELGRGGMAVVYKATELELLRPVALKVLPPEMSASPSMAERFKREARMAASLDHPNIIPVYRVGQTASGGLFYIAMKFIEGRSLEAILEAQGALPLAASMLILRAATAALAFAHQNRVVHRDIKGANILIDHDGRIVVADFGIARIAEDASLTHTGHIVGTPYYMSPEQCAGHRVGAQSDQYSLGVVAFQMLAGSVPFKAETLPGVMQHHFFTPVPDLTKVRSDVPPALLAWINQAMAKRPGDRFASTQDMLAALEGVQLTDAERRSGEQALRDLVFGTLVPKVSTGMLPPLADTVLMTPPNVRAMEQRDAARRSRLRLAATAAVGAVLLSGGTYALTTRAAAHAAAAERRPAPNVADTARPAPQGPAATAATRTTAVALTADTAPSSAARPGSKPARPAARETSAAAASSTPTTARGDHELSYAAGPATPGASAGDSANAGVGKLRVRVYPTDAEIYVDGRRLGRGVVVDSVVAAGARRLRVTAPGYVTLDTAFTVRPGETAQLVGLRLRTADGGAP
ncbi:MAG TPA: serine/threonine-protein kinase [Gemmatimonadaceae bacterium]|nr:serine/threonine-protein kinase [Gemmatimonadaceae bacterium]